MSIDSLPSAEPSPANTVRGACPHDCPDTCAMLVTVEDGKAVRVAGDPEHPFTQGFLCAKVNRYIERTYHPDRLTTPLRRVGPKGSGQFEPISWDAALDEIATRLTGIVSEFGGESVLPYSYAGTMGMVQAESMDHRFFHKLGASKLDRTICSSAGAAGMRMTVGANIGADGEGLPQSDLVLLWGTNTLTANPHLWPFILKARENGAPIICIDPIRTRTAMQCDEWLPIRPGTDAALALGMMHVIFDRGLEDKEYLAQFTIGEDKLRARVAEWTPRRTAEVTGLTEAAIISLGERFGKARAAFIRVNYGLQRHAGGAMAVRTLACLPAVTGHWRRPGGGIQLSTSANFQFNKAALHRTDLGPAARTINMIRLGDALNRGDAGVGGGPVKAVIVYNSNPASVAPDRNAVVQGFAREDLFTVVLEHFQTDTADWADIVLPATTQLEHWDVHFAYGHHYLTLNQPSIAPVGESKPNSEIFRLIAQRMGMRDECFLDDDITLIRQALETNSPKLQGITFEGLLEKGWMRLNVPTPYLPYANGGFSTPSGKVEFHSERMAEMGLDPVPGYTPPYESIERDPERVKRFPLTLISSPAHQFLNTTFVNVKSLRRQAREPEVLLHPHDAERRAISPGMMVTVHNDRGAFLAKARVEETIKEGVVWAPSIWWAKLTEDDANANQTTSQRVTDMGNGPVFYDNQVEVSAS